MKRISFLKRQIGKCLLCSLATFPLVQTDGASQQGCQSDRGITRRGCYIRNNSGARSPFFVPFHNEKVLGGNAGYPHGQSPQKEMMAVCMPKEVGKRRYSGFNLLSEEIVLVLKTIASGDFILNGFDNKSLRRRVCKNSGNKKAINKTTRLLSRLKAHGLIKKVPRKNRYYLTSRGRDITNILLLFLSKELLKGMSSKMCKFFKKMVTIHSRF